MTDHQLYAIYASAFREASHFESEGESGRPDGSGFGLWRGRVSSIERAVADLAIHEATNGTPMRSRDQFERCLREGALLFRKLRQRDREPVEVAGTSAGPRGVAWAGT